MESINVLYEYEFKNKMRLKLDLRHYRAGFKGLVAAKRSRSLKK